ncbi:MAG: hypothetical protein QNJ72_14880 [Pleurocapsa sp. MO_226.B13]|nr:hypothetical protein [Pleurocapsa sp. MO_226.B13]
MTNSSDRSQVQYAVYRVTGQGSGSGLQYTLTAGPFTERRQALRKAEELNQIESDVYLVYVVSEYKGESWSPERPSSFSWETDNRE